MVGDGNSGQQINGAAGIGQRASAGTRPIRLLQLTDLHLYAESDGRLLGQNTRATFESVLDLARQRHWPPDAVVLTGDLVHDERSDAYLYLRQRLQQLDVRYFCIPGNHDSPRLLADCLDPRAGSGLRIESLGAWDLLLIDSTLPGQEGGAIDELVLQAIDSHLSANPDRPALIFLHHHPLPVGSRWIDTMGAENGARLLAQAESHPNMRAILWGHIHQSFQGRSGHAQLLAAPSTSVQFLPGSKDFALDTLPPGYRWLELHDDGLLETGIERTDGYPDPLSLSMDGY
jgi:Icc protein